jgi:hypothetical protein
MVMDPISGAAPSLLLASLLYASQFNCIQALFDSPPTSILDNHQHRQAHNRNDQDDQEEKCGNYKAGRDKYGYYHLTLPAGAPVR